MVDIWVEPSVDFKNNKLKVVMEFTEEERVQSVDGVQNFISNLLYIPPKTKTVYCTSRNTGPSYNSDPIHMLYLGTSIEEAEKAVGDFSKYQRPESRWPSPGSRSIYTALPNVMKKELIQYYMADGWWYSIFMFNLKE